MAKSLSLWNGFRLQFRSHILKQYMKAVGIGIIQGWKLELAHSPMRVSSPSGEWKSQVTRPVWRVEFSCSGK